MNPEPNPESRRKPAAARPGRPGVDALFEGIRRGDRAMLARGITLVESSAGRHEAEAQELLRRLMPHTGGARRVGVTGVPGVGKSTFLETLGLFLCGRGHRVAVLAVDPTSSLTGGSILGDRTRMERLTAEPAAFIRPSPSGGQLGGVARRTRETMLLCEAAGFDVVLVETVGVGQSETTLRSMVDFFLLLLLPGAGDDLQGIKRGIMEMADAVLVNKADGDNRARAQAAMAEQSQALHHLGSATPGWRTPVALCSGLKGEGVVEAWAVVERFFSEMRASGAIESRRRQQTLRWMDDLAEEELRNRFRSDPGVRQVRALLERGVLEGGVTAVEAARTLYRVFREGCPTAAPETRTDRPMAGTEPGSGPASSEAQPPHPPC